MKYEKIGECQPKLEKWLELVNSVPYGKYTYLRGWEILVSNAYFELTGEDIRQMDYPPPYLYTENWETPGSHLDEIYQQTFTRAIESLKEETKEFPKLYSYLFEIEDYPAIENKYDKIRFEVKTRDYEKSAFQRYETFLEMRTDIRKIAFSCMDYRKTGRFTDIRTLFERFGLKNADSGYLSNFIIKEGKIDFESELIQVLRGIDPKRLRVCPICKAIFWARRIEASTCQEKKCSNTFHQRKLRINEYEKRFDELFETYKKLESSLSSENSLVEQQRQKVNKLKEKINREKIKNGTL